ncbi:hypothetical protein D031_2450A, partial [Vibrio parahaemolyticus VP-48]
MMRNRNNSSRLRG